MLRLIAQTNEMSGDINNAISEMQDADIAAYVIRGIQENKELLAALITLSIHIVQHILEGWRKKLFAKEQQLKIHIEIEGRVTEITEKDVISDQALLAKLLNVHPDLDRLVSNEGKVKIVTFDKERENKTIEVKL